jgi:hypothetical protein
MPKVVLSAEKQPAEKPFPWRCPKCRQPAVTRVTMPYREEWRIPVEWLVWDEKSPCPIENPLRKSFLEVKGAKKRLKDTIREHFLRELVISEGT